MTTRKWIGLSFAMLISAAVIADIFRYLQPQKLFKTQVESQQDIQLINASEIIMVYNANGGVFPGIAHVIHKTFFPKSYPCNLCFLAFGNFGKKEEWKNFLETIPYKKSELHKDSFKRRYEPGDLALPAILITNGKETRVLVSAAEINDQHSLAALIKLVQKKKVITSQYN